MPQELVLVYEKESGTPHYMHSVDAAEATRLGDYTYAVPEGKEPDDAAKAAAMARARGMSPPAHAELLTEEERTEARRVANQATVPVVTVPTGTPVVLSQGTPPTAPPEPAPARSTGRSTTTRESEEKK